MDNLTHSLVGLAAAKAGLDKLSSRATLACILASNVPDSDIVALIVGGRWSFLHHHRGITHSIFGVVVLAFLFPLLYHLLSILVDKLRQRPPTSSLRGLIIASVIVTATHPFLDWTNNYGVRLLLPFSNRWSYGDLVFVVDPVLWLLFGGASFLLTKRTKVNLGLWLLVGGATTTLVMFTARPEDVTIVRTFWIIAIIAILLVFKFKSENRPGPRFAYAAFVLAACYWLLLAGAHHLAWRQSESIARDIATHNGESVANLATMPSVANPLHWRTVFATERATYRFDVRLGSDHQASDLFRFERPGPIADPLVAKAEQDPRAQIFLEFARFPVIKTDPNCLGETLVQFADLRYTEPGSGRGTFSLDVPVECPPVVSNSKR